MSPFLLTQYIHPISSPIELEGTEYALDNPRGEEEINAIYEVLSRMYEKAGEHNPGVILFPLDNPEKPDIVTLRGGIENFISNYSEIDEYVKNNIEKIDHNTDLLRFIASSWIIIRYDDEGRYEVLKGEQLRISEENRDLPTGSRSFIMLDDDDPIIANAKKLEEYAYLLTLLIHTEPDEPPFKSILIHQHWQHIGDPEISQSLSHAILSFIISGFKNFQKNPSERWQCFFEIKDDIIKASTIIDNIYKSDYKDSIIYLSEVLSKLGKNSIDAKLSIVLLTSLIELLLTHSPNHQRFNVEDSISKQFKLKASILIYLSNREVFDLEKIKQRLGEIYNQRSNIAHGNFGELKRFIVKKSNELKKSNPNYDDSSVLFDLINDLRRYIRALIGMIARDPDLVKFMKEN